MTVTQMIQICNSRIELVVAGRRFVLHFIPTQRLRREIVKAWMTTKREGRT